MGAILRITGRGFNPDEFDIGWRMKPSAIHHKEDIYFRTKKRRGTSELIFDISDADYSDLKGQINDTITFLKKNYRHLKRISSYKTIETIDIDFAFDSKIDRKKVEIQNEYFPAELIKLAGSLNMGIALMIWPFNSIIKK